MVYHWVQSEVLCFQMIQKFKYGQSEIYVPPGGCWEVKGEGALVLGCN